MDAAIAGFIETAEDEDAAVERMKRALGSEPDASAGPHEPKDTSRAAVIVAIVGFALLALVIEVF